MAERAKSHLPPVPVCDQRCVTAVALGCGGAGSHLRCAAAGDEVEDWIDTVLLLTEVAVDLQTDRIGEHRVISTRQLRLERVAVRPGRAVDQLQASTAVKRRP